MRPASTANSFFSKPRNAQPRSDKGADKLGALKQFASDQLSKFD
jgi:hypothetical protein